jgi:hypothetical protein
MSQQINLYNAAFVPRREWLTAQSLAVAVAALLALVTVAAVWARLDARNSAVELAVAQARQKATLEQLETARRQLGVRKPSAALQAELRDQQQLLVSRDTVLAVLNDGMGGQDGAGIGFAEYLRGLARQSVSGLWLTGFSVAAGGNDMSLRGRALDKTLLPDYVRRLNGEKAFAGRSFASLRVDAKEEPAAAGLPARSYVEFHLAATAGEEPKR